MGWSRGSHLLSWESSGNGATFIFFQEHMTTWSVHGHRVYKHLPNDYFSNWACPTACNDSVIVL